MECAVISQRYLRGFTAAEKAELWDRWSLKAYDDGVETTLMDLEWTSINVPGRSTQVRTLAWSVVAPGFYRNAAIA